MEILSISIPIIYIIGILLIFAFSKKLLKKYPNIAKVATLLEVYSVIFVILFFVYGYINDKENSITQKESFSMNYLTSIEDNEVFDAINFTEIMLRIELMYREKPKKIFALESGEILGDFDGVISYFLTNYGKIHSRYRERVTQCLNNELCDREVVKKIYCPSFRKYIKPISTWRYRNFQRCVKDKHPDLMLVELDRTIESGIELCELDRDRLEAIPRKVIEADKGKKCFNESKWKP